jgi:hypothetical protein
MTSLTKLTTLCFLLSVAIQPSIAAQPATYDLNADWSDVSNSNGVWTYREGTNTLPHVAAWQGLSGDFDTPQPAWAPNATGSSNLPPWFKSSAIVGLPHPHDWQIGDVLTHSTDGFNGIGNGASNVIWTSPVVGTATISGNVWMGRDISRSNHWALYHNGSLLTEGDISSGDPYNRASPFDFANGSGGPLVLQDIPVSAGTVFELRITRTSVPGDYAGVNFTVTTIPEPATAILAVACAAAFSIRRGKRRQLTVRD